MNFKTSVKMTVTLKITRDSKMGNSSHPFPETTKKMYLFNARRNYVTANFGLPYVYCISVVRVSDEYLKKHGNLAGFNELMADCIKNNFKLVAVNGKKLKKAINPYNESYAIPLFKEDEFELILNCELV